MFKDIRGFEGFYRISKSGIVFDVSKNSRKHSTKNSHGYKVIYLSKNGDGNQFRINRLVALTYLPNLENKPCVNHKNGIKYDDRVSNLEWVTHKENTRHAMDTGLMKVKKGQEHSQSKLTEKDVLEIRELCENGYLFQYEIAEIYGIARNTVSSINIRVLWSHI